VAGIRSAGASAEVVDLVSASAARVAAMTVSMSAADTSWWVTART
jgi:hypothetical protein